MIRTPQIPRELPESLCTCPYCDEQRQGTFENHLRFACGTALRATDHKIITQGDLCRLRVQLAAAQAHEKRALESDSTLASCNCLTKTPDYQQHKAGCKYRLICERDYARNLLELRDDKIDELTEAVNKLVNAVVNEPELPGEMPENVWEAFQGMNKRTMTAYLRKSIRMMKRNILTAAGRMIPGSLREGEEHTDKPLL